MTFSNDVWGLFCIPYRIPNVDNALAWMDYNDINDKSDQIGIKNDNNIIFKPNLITFVIYIKLDVK